MSSIRFTPVAAALAALLSLPGLGHAQSDPVVLSFATVGDSRQDPTTQDRSSPLTAQDAIWLQSTKPFARILRTIQTQKPNLLFFNGDMIMGYGKADVPADTSLTGLKNSQLMKFFKQYAFWRGMVAPVIETGTYVVPVPGNHEVQCNSAVDSTCVSGKNAYKVNEDAWRDNMADLIVDSSRLTPLLPAGQALANVDVTDHATLDGLTTPQNQLSYSFDIGNSHFAVINTDPTGADSTAPAAWLASDFSAAAGRGAQHFFVFGHKMAYTYNYTGPDGTVATGNNNKLGGLDVNTAKRDAFWTVIEQYGATYFCGHEHTFNMSQPLGKSWQVLVGSGGSPFDPKAGSTAPNPVTNRYYAWANVKVFQSGKVQIDAWGFNGDTANYGPTQLIQSVTLAH